MYNLTTSGYRTVKENKAKVTSETADRAVARCLTRCGEVGNRDKVREGSCDKHQQGTRREG